jgi:hypothetical protein
VFPKLSLHASIGTFQASSVSIFGIQGLKEHLPFLVAIFGSGVRLFSFASTGRVAVMMMVVDVVMKMKIHQGYHFLSPLQQGWHH